MLKKLNVYGEQIDWGVILKLSEHDLIISDPKCRFFLCPYSQTKLKIFILYVRPNLLAN